MNGSNMPHWLGQRAHLTPRRIALAGEGVEWTFHELDQKVQRTARQLAYIGVKKGDRVALLCRNGLHSVLLIHALSRLGAVLVPLNIRLAPQEIAWQLTDAEVKGMVFDRFLAGKAESLRKNIQGRFLVEWEELRSGPEADVPLLTRVDLDALHTLMYTSGTTGRPKGVMLTYGNHWWSATGSAFNLGLQPEDRWLAAVPLFHMSGLSILIRSVIYGITAVVHESFDPERVNRAITEEGITHVSVVSAMLSSMLDVLGEKRYPPSFRCMLLGGGPAPKPLLERCKEKGIPVFQTYGMTETASQIVTLSPEDMLRKLGSAGKPLFPAELRIVENGRDLPPGQPGEIVVRGPNVTPGYWRRQKDTERTIREGWLHTGDIGYVDREGFLYVLDRRSDLIISGGENVYPAEVEAVLLSHPDVEDAGVTGISHKRWGQVPVAFVKTRKGMVTEEALIAFCRDRLAKYKVPSRVVFVEALPRNASKKLLRRRLKDLLPEEGGRT